MENNLHIEANVKQAVPFFMVSNIEISLSFYVNRLGFELKNKWEPRGKIEWCWLQRDSVSIMLQEPRNKKKTEQEQDVPNGKGVSICFQCKDALALYHEFSAKGITMKEPFVGNNMWVINFSDPDGYKLDFESPTDVAEETKYSEWVQSSKTK